MKLFLDTSVLLSGILRRNNHSWRLLNNKFEFIINEFVMIEFRRQLKKFGYNEEMASALVDSIAQKCRVAKKPKKEEFAKFRLRYKSDRPIVCSAVKEKCDFLVTEDEHLKIDARKYIKAVSPRDLIL